MDKIIREVVEVKLHSISREVGFSQSGLWKPLIYTLKEPKKVLSKDKTYTSS
jgi:hypothetical protein